MQRHENKKAGGLAIIPLFFIVYTIRKTCYVQFYDGPWGIADQEHYFKYNTKKHYLEEKFFKKRAISLHQKTGMIEFALKIIFNLNRLCENTIPYADPIKSLFYCDFLRK